ncbi:MAG: hypothetical protein CMQ20_08240 [Gammaproteobacteria bacterium]|jgi:cell division protein FtsB|nr:hypothetical protein [Gammaproteobacteria bacterium]|tara:strand:- start:489 stop:668 length:180 start_codon:yes stop_codon:yes gene_type:complete
MIRFRDFFSQGKLLSVQRKEIEQLQAERQKLQAENNSMREGMRRCVTCEYRQAARKKAD